MQVSIDRRPTTWDCTAFVLAGDGIDAAEVDDAIADNGFFLDRDDVLIGDDNAPAWIKDHDDPFTITVTAAV